MSTRATFRSAVAFAAVLVAAAPSPSQANSIVVRAQGANPAAIQAAVDSFRETMSPNNGVGGSFASGRREINWDGVPDNFAAPNSMPEDFFNVSSPRGVMMNTVNEVSGSAFNSFFVSADSNNPDNAPVEFGNLNAQYPGIFQPFSSPRLMIARADHVIELTFFVPGTNIPATVTAFGAVFADVDVGNHATLRFFSADGRQISAVAGSVASGGLSFLGVRFTEPEERAARIIIQVGTVAPGAGVIDGGSDDVIALDDFIYSEPRPQYELYEDQFENL